MFCLTRALGVWAAAVSVKMADMAEMVTLSTGAEARVHNAPSECAVICANGGQAGEVAGTWSASIEWLVGRLAPAFPALRFLEVRYRIKSWRRLEWCIEDVCAAVSAAGARRSILVGFSMGGAVSIAAAAAPTVERVVGLAPWIPDRLSLDTLAGRRLDVIHGSLDRPLPGIPGVSPASSRRGFDRARALGVPGSYTLIQGAIHPIALRLPGGRPVSFPRGRRWVELVGSQLVAFA
jgi:pimeloyl-ACP methyl ester carboxylesterase